MHKLVGAISNILGAMATVDFPRYFRTRKLLLSSPNVILQVVPGSSKEAFIVIECTPAKRPAT